MTVGEEIARLFRVNRQALASAPSAAIATAYVNPAGFLLIADELEQLPRIRVLLGAEPLPDPVLTERADEAVRARLREALTDHDAWLRAERDALGFAPEATMSAKRLVSWLRAADERGEPVVEIRRYTGGFLHGKAYISHHPTHAAYLAGSSNLTLAGLTRNAELNVGASGQHGSTGQVVDWFEECWGDSEPYDLAALYEPLWGEHSPWTVYLRMLLERYGAHLDEEKSESLRFELTRFQVDGVRRMRRLLDEIGGVLVADEVGLGKTYLALEVIASASEELRQRVLIAAPAALKAGVWDPILKRYGMSRRVSVHSYEEIRNRMDPEHDEHRDFVDLAEDAALVIIDEAHNLRNASAARSAALDRVILSGKHPKKVVLLTATPVNNSLIDLETLVKYFVRDDARFASRGIPSIREYIRQAQRMDPEALTPAHLFDLMDEVAVRRTRSFVKQNYRGETVPGPNGTKIVVEFPDPDVYQVDYTLDEAGEALVNAVTYALDIPESETHVASFEVRRNDPRRLLLSRYAPSAYLKSEKLDGGQVSNMGLLRSALLKRLESSPQALASTLQVLITAHEGFLAALDQGTVLIGGALRDYISSESEDLDEIVAGLDTDDAHQATPAADYRADVLASDVTLDLELLRSIRQLALDAAAGREPKAQRLVDELVTIAADAQTTSAKGVSSGDRRKLIVFSTYADTIRDLHERISAALEEAPEDSPLADYRGRLAPPIIGEYASGKTGGIHQSSRANAIAGFAPRTAGKLSEEGLPLHPDNFDILLTTDVLAEGVNLQQAGRIVNYDLPWNPMRIVQRHGRVDRIGSEHDKIHLGVFLPTEHLDEYLNLENTLIRKLKQADAAVGTGKVLPGVNHYPPKDHYDGSDIIDKVDHLVEANGGSAAGSGEEYRRRLANALDAEPGLRDHLEALPHGIGSGFRSTAVEGNHYVFCMRMGPDDSEHVWFRNVPVDENWAPIADDDGVMTVEDDTLKSLVTADPGCVSMPRELSDSAFRGAYDAWALARDNAHEEWMRGTDPANLTPDLPKVFRDAASIVLEHGGGLAPGRQGRIMKQLKAVPSVKARNAMRQAIKGQPVGPELVPVIQAVLDQFGIQPAEKVVPLTPISQDGVRLVAWMAVQGTKAATKEIGS
ncbi:MAG: helicase [Actinobacteria bacterium]|nr:helicase [Actinomycetota bacterium]MBU1609610.1 helicase [Actinomycetota bacterium]MBU2315445.1 helicase [Actinomycetota bacterium]MBU2384701.1 helicase [Actinomycetota bacterium]